MSAGSHSAWDRVELHSKKHDVLVDRIRARRANRKTFQLSKVPVIIFNFIQRYSPEMATILIGMRDGMVSLGYICILLILILYIYAVAGCVFFQKNDMWHFRSIEIAFISLLRCGFFDGWGDILYINYYGCDVYTMDVYTGNEEEKSPRLGGVAYCNPSPYKEDKFGSQPQPILTVVYLGSFLFIVSMAVLSLIIGAIGDAMMNASIQMKRNTFARKVVWQQSDAQAIIERREQSLDYNRTQTEAIRLLKLALNGRNIFKKKKFVFTKSDFWYKVRKYVEIICYYCGIIADSVMYENFMIFTILSTAVLAGLQTMKGQTEYFVEVTEALNWVIQAIFTFDCAIKIVAEGKRPYHYFQDNWNNFDFLLVVVAYADAIGLIQFQPLFLRLFRLFRVLKLLKRFRQLQVIINAITSCSLSVAIIGVYFILYLIIYAAIGVALFGKDDGFHFGTLYMGVLSVFQSSTYDNFSSVMYVSLYGCEQFEYPGLGDWSKYCVDPPAPNFFAAYVYFLFNAIVGGCVLINLFIGLMCSAMIDSYDNLELYTKTDEMVHKIGIRNKLPSGLINKYRQIFELLDVTNGDRVGLVELMYAYRLSGGTSNEDEIRKIFVLVDTDMSQYIEFHEFIVFMLHIHHDKYVQKTKAKTDKIRKSFSNRYIDELTEDMVEQYKRSAIRHLLQATHPNSNDKLSRDERANLAEVIEKLSSVHGLEELKATMKSVSTDLIFKKSEKEDLSSEGRESIFLAAAEGAGGGTRKSSQTQPKGYGNNFNSPYSTPRLENTRNSSKKDLEPGTPPAALIRPSFIHPGELGAEKLVQDECHAEYQNNLKRYSQTHSMGISMLSQTAKSYKVAIQNGFSAKDDLVLCPVGTDRYERKLRAFVNSMSEINTCSQAFVDSYDEQADYAPEEVLIPLMRFREEKEMEKSALEEYLREIQPINSHDDENEVSPSKVAFNLPSESKYERRTMRGTDDRSERSGLLDSARSGASSSMRSSETSYYSETDDDDDDDDDYVSEASRASSLEHGVNFLIDDMDNGSVHKYMSIDNGKNSSNLYMPVESVHEIKDARVKDSVRDVLVTEAPSELLSSLRVISTSQSKVKEKSEMESSPPEQPIVAEDKSSMRDPSAKKTPFRKSSVKMSAKEGKQSKQDATEKKSPSPKKTRFKPPPPSTPSPNASPAAKQPASAHIKEEEIQQDEQKRILNVLREPSSSSKTQAWTVTVEPEEKEPRGVVKHGASQLTEFRPRGKVASPENVHGDIVGSPSPLKIEQLEAEHKKIQVINGKRGSPSRVNREFKPRAPKTPPPNSPGNSALPNSSSAFISPVPEVDRATNAVKDGVVQLGKVHSNLGDANNEVESLTVSEGVLNVREDESRAEIETAFVYIKPHANTSLTRQICVSFFRSKGIGVVEEGDVKGIDIDAEMMFDKQYFKFADYAFGNAHEFKFREESLIEFRTKFGSDFHALANEGLVLNCVEACDLLQCSNDHLHELWGNACEEGNCIKLGNSCYCAQFDAEGDGETIFYVVNGFFKSMRASYVGPESSIHYYCLKWVKCSENQHLTVRKFIDFIGDTNPFSATADSLRGLLFANRNSLGLKNAPSSEYNFIHASKSAYESLVERSRWTIMPLKRDPLGNRLIESNVQLRKLSWWISNPVLLDEDLPKKIRGKRASDLLYGLGHEEAYHASMSILSRKLTCVK